ncbi:MAG: hypothetical protein QQN63_01515 [Nitrosopumilus sp.]
MRTPKYLSPTSITLALSDMEEFYLRYLADVKTEKFPQTQPMSIGSAFDAKVKSYLHYNLFGNYGKGDIYDFKNIFELQVEAHNRDWAIQHCEIVFKAYKKSGSLADLMLELQSANGQPRFEITLEGRVSHETNVGGVPLLGKPDLYFVSAGGSHVIRDWKVNGYCGTRNLSPKRGYVTIRDGWGSQDGPPSRNVNTPHKDAQCIRISGINVNIADYLENIDAAWAQQLSIYGWLLGEPIASNFIVGIEQLVCSPGKIRVATFSNRISPDFQHSLYRTASNLWAKIQSGHIFSELSLEESRDRCLTLDRYHEAFKPSDDPKDKWFAQATRKQKDF